MWNLLVVAVEVIAPSCFVLQTLIVAASSVVAKSFFNQFHL